MDRDTLLRLYREMTLIRKTEEQLVRSVEAGQVPGGCHTYIGQEAVAVGVSAHLTRDDVIFSTHRGHGHALAKGVEPGPLIAELFGKETGVSKGRGGSMHLFAPEVGLLGTSGIVAPSILQATGAGYSFKLKKQPHVGVGYFGDGASNNGAFHEGLNLATVFDLPVLFVCENNLYATEMSFDATTRSTDVAARAANYGLPGVQVNGNDVIAVYEVAKTAIERARSGGGPTLIEARTYRVRPHAEGARLAGYRTLEEIEAWKLRDPIVSLAARLTLDGIATEAELAGIDTEI
ncbi:MAG: thiamine pyrophosphate-dependent dehydrogenase E1 component subunit alpha, partial [Thermomicrobiales bacterium]|nr:thiamine pyrophosphate-dependent dehydrogenase E1 component subunit alpha [Thermomicrobiales bacterium]